MSFHFNFTSVCIWVQTSTQWYFMIHSSQIILGWIAAAQEEFSVRALTSHRIKTHMCGKCHGPDDLLEPACYTSNQKAHRRPQQFNAHQPKLLSKCLSGVLLFSYFPGICMTQDETIKKTLSIFKLYLPPNLSTKPDKKNKEKENKPEEKQTLSKNR